MDSNADRHPNTEEREDIWRQRQAERRRLRAGWVLASTLLLILVTLLIAYSVSRMNQRAPQMTVTPASGPVGTLITVAGSSWPSEQGVSVALSPSVTPGADALTLATLANTGATWSITAPIPDTPPWRDLTTFYVVALSPDRKVIASQPFTRLPQQAAANPTAVAVVVIEATPVPAIVVPAQPVPPAAPVATPTASAPIGVVIASQETIGRPRRLLGPVTAIDPAQRIVNVGLTQNLAVRAEIPASLAIATTDGQPVNLASIPVGAQVDIQGLDNGKGIIIAERFVVVSLPGVVSVPTPAAVAPTTFSGWRGEYYPNPTLSGAPTVIRDDADLNFNWGTQPPPGLTTPAFSARWSRTLDLAAGNYLFRTVGDGGVRVWLDGWLVIDAWRDAPGTWMGDLLNVQGGPHVMQVEYFNTGGEARLQVTVEGFAGYPEWRGEYFANPTLSGPPSLLRNDADLNLNWGDAAPGPGLPADGFSARWTRTVDFTSGDYRFSAQANGGVRLWVDDTLILDAWQAGTNAPTRDFRGLTTGTHRVRVEYVNPSGPASILARWERLP